MSQTHAACDTTPPCPSELTLSIYVDRELDLEGTRRVDTHLVQCRACRESVIALGDEGAALRSALSLEEVTRVAASPVELSPELGWGAGATLAASLAAVTVVGWLLELRAPSTLEWLNPFSLGGLFAMFFDTVTLLREQGSAIYQLAVASAALLSVAFILTSTFTLATRRLFERAGVAAILGAAGLVAGAPSPAEAIELVFHRDAYVLPSGEVVEDTIVTNAKSVDIQGTLHGDLVAIGDRVVVTGVVDGNVLSGARRVEIDGHVTGSLVAIGERVQIVGRVDGNAATAADQASVGEGARIGRGLASFGDGLSIAGSVERDVLANVEWLELRGRIGRGVIARVEQADVLRTADVGGDLELHHRGDADGIVVDDGATIAGERTIEVARMAHGSRFARYAHHEFYVFLAVSFAAALATGLLVFRAAPWLFAPSLRTGTDLAWHLGHGLAVVFAGPFAILLVACTVVGIPVAIAGLASWIACLYLAKVVVGATIGLALLRAPADVEWRAFALPLATGLAVVAVATALPFVGGVMTLLVLLVGSGAIAMRVRERLAR